jgi:hypothetical protein
MDLWKRILQLFRVQSPVNHAYQAFLLIYAKTQNDEYSDFPKN